MSLFAPLRGLCPPADRAAEVAELPYDVMNRAEARVMAEGRPHSFLHVSRPDIDLPDDAAPDGEQALEHAAAAFQRLRADGLLIRDQRAGYHAYRLTWRGRSQTGVVGVADVAAYDTGRIKRHEHTRPAKQADRAAQILAVGAQTGPAFLLHHPDPVISEVLARVTATAAATDFAGPGGVRHEVWPIAAAEDVAALSSAYDGLDAMYIADGHHRSAAASVVHAQLGTPASAAFLAVAFPTDEVAILAYNRLVRAPEGTSAADLLAAIAGQVDLTAEPGPVDPDRPGQVGLYLAGDWYRLVLPTPAQGGPAQRLDVAVLQDRVLAPVLGIADPRTDSRIDFVGGIRPLSELTEAVDRGAWTAAFVMHPTTVSDLVAVADAGEIMPPKSTWFEPKLLDGLVSHVLD